MTTVEEPTTVVWEPGVPLYRPGQYTQYVFNFREEADSEVCSCGDAASWPEPMGSRVLPQGDEIGDLIAAVRADREREAAS